MWKDALYAALLTGLLLAPEDLKALSPEYEELLDDAQLLLEEEKFKEAVKVYKKAQKLDPSPSFDLAIGLATALNRMEAFATAARSAREALGLATEPAQEVMAYSQLGISAYANGNADKNGLREAEMALRKVLELHDGEGAGSRYLLGVVLLKQERDEEGIAELKEFLERYPEERSADRARSLIKDPRRARIPLIPEFDVVTLAGELLSSEDLKGKVVLLDFWGTWCKPCVNAIPHLQRLHRRSAKDPFVLVGITADSDEKLRKFLEKNKMSWPQVMDEGHEVTHDTFGVTRFPTYILVDHKGLIVYRRSGWSEKIGTEVSQEVARAINAAKRAARKKSKLSVL